MKLLGRWRAPFNTGLKTFKKYIDNTAGRGARKWVQCASARCLSLSPSTDVARLWFQCLLMSITGAALCLSPGEYSICGHEYSTPASLLGSAWIIDRLLVGLSLSTVTASHRSYLNPLIEEEEETRHCGSARLWRSASREREAGLEIVLSLNRSHVQLSFHDFVFQYVKFSCFQFQPRFRLCCCNI